MQKIGSCNFTELPIEYQDLFESGQSQSSKELFFESKPPSSAIVAAIFLGSVYLIPSLFLIISAIISFIQKPKLISKIVDDLTSGVVFFIVGLLLLIVIVWGLYFMLKMAWQSLKRAEAWIRINRMKRTNNHHYGLFFDEYNMVLNHGDFFDDFTSAFLPKKSITGHQVSQIRVWFPKRSFDIDVVKIQYLDEQNQSKELVIKERFTLTAIKMNEQIQKWMSI